MVDGDLFILYFLLATAQKFYIREGGKHFSIAMVGLSTPDTQKFA